MTDIIKVGLRNHVYLALDCDMGLRQEIRDHFTFNVPGAKYTPAYKFGGWDGTISLCDVRKGTLWAGVFPELKEWADKQGYTLEVVESDYGLPGTKTDVTPEELVEFIQQLEIPNIKIRDYQYEAVYKAIRNKRHTILSSTGSGKSLIIYLILSYITRNLNAPSLIVVPTTTLVHQLVGDFSDYGYDVSTVHKIMAGMEKDTKALVTVSTWQSLMKLPPSWFDRYGCVIIDECHGAKATELTKLLEKCTNASYRFGLTGSLDNSKAHHMSIQGALGPIVRVTETKTLQDQGHLAEIDIKCIVLDYAKDTKKMLRGTDYHREIDFIVGHERRNRFIVRLAEHLKGNTLILYTFVEKHGDLLDAMLSKSIQDGSYFYVHGGVDSEERDQVRYIVENLDNAVILASMGTFSTGINIKRIHNIILASPTKSVIRVLQSIGRGLRKGEGKDELVLYDIADDLANSKTKKNFAYKHFVERLAIYTKEQFPYSISTVEIEK